MKTAGLYIHIPYCVSKCSYCDFSSVRLNYSVGRYIDCLENELRISAHLLDEYIIDTIFIGGGTPTSIDSNFILRIMKTVKELYTITSNAEITIEANPGTINSMNAEDYIKAGINRVSLGIQSFDDSLLRSIGRIHTGEVAAETIRLLKECGFDNLNGDLMFGLPGQTIEGFLADIDYASRLGLKHISMYGLIIEDNTLMHAWQKKGLLELQDEALERSMYHKGRERLTENGYIQYEISNFSQRGWECRHNIGYWNLKPYLGVGLSSHSNLGDSRFWNTDSFETYFEMIEKGTRAVEGEEILNQETRAGEYLILGIRLTEGIILDEFYEMFGFRAEDRYKVPLQKHAASGLIEISEKRIRLTERGMDLSNQVEVDFIP
jgi:oxygen-independent coproporphyrinogen-3 oxidase